VLVDPFACLHILERMTYRITVFDDILALFDILNQHFVACGNVFFQHHLYVVDLDDVALFLVSETNHHRISGIDL
jgi:hypothetical protein